MRKFEILCQKIILVEGDDDKNFFDKFIEETGISGIQVHPVGGKDSFNSPNFRSIINMPAFPQVKSLGIIKDADGDASIAFSSICTVLRNVGLSVPTNVKEFVGETLRIGVLIIPPNESTGEIEDLCLSSIRGYRELECIDNYFDCLRQKLPSDKYPSNLSKAKIQAFLASREESVPHLGIAAQRNYFPFDHAVFADIKNFLTVL